MENLVARHSATTTKTSLRFQLAGGVIVLLAVVLAGLYVRLLNQTVDDLRATVMSGSSPRANGNVVSPNSVATTRVDATQTGPTRTIADAPPPVAVETSPPPANATVVKSNTQAEGAGKPGPLGDASMTRQARVANQPRQVARHPTASAAGTERQAASVMSSEATRSANAAAVIPTPSLIKTEPDRPAPASLVPCTAPIVALGLCTAPPIQLKERP